MTFHTEMTVEDVEQKVNEGYEVVKATHNGNGRYVELLKAGDTSFIELQYYMESEDALQTVKSRYIN